MKRDCTQGSPLKQGDVVRVANTAQKGGCFVETPSNDNDRWYVAFDTLELVRLLFPKHFNGFKHSY